MQLHFWFLLFSVLVYVQISSSFLWKSHRGHIVRTEAIPSRKGHRGPPAGQSSRPLKALGSNNQVAYRPPRPSKRPRGKKNRKTSKEDPKKPVVFFPSGEDDCGEVSSGGGFSTFSFLAFVLAAYNLVGLIANNANNNKNSNNNNNNDNNNNDNIVNENNSNNNANVMNSVMLQPPGPGRKKREILKHLDRIVQRIHLDNTTSSCAEKQAAVSVVGLLDTWFVAMTSDNMNCTHKMICELNRSSRKMDETATIIAEVGSIALAKMLPGSRIKGLEDLLVRAAETGRSSGDCEMFYADCFEQDLRIAEEKKNQLMRQFYYLNNMPK